MSHYLPDLDDIFFTLFEVLDVDEVFTESYPDMDADLYRDIIKEMARFVEEYWANSFQEADRFELSVDEAGEVSLDESMKASLVKFRELGWDTFGVAEGAGGTAVPRPVFWGAWELLIGANPTGAFYIGSTLLSNVIWQEGTDAQKDLMKICVERGWGGTMALTEADAGSDVGAGLTKARHLEGDWWALEGTKRFITGGERDDVENILHLVLARREGGEPGTKGLSMFIVPKYLVNGDGSLGERNGVRCTRVEHKLGIRGSVTAELTFGDREIARGWLVGGTHDGIRQMFEVIERARMMIGVKAAATTSTAYLNALEYASERIQGKDLTEARNKDAESVPILAHPDVKRTLMGLRAHSEAMRGLNLYTALCNEQGATGEVEAGKRGELLLPMVKGYCSERGFEMVSQALGVLGGAGYTTEYPLEQYLRDSRIDTIYEGTTAIQGLDLFFRKIAKDQGAALMALSGDIARDIEEGEGFEEGRENLKEALETVSGLVMTMVSWAMASRGTPEAIYKVGLTSTELLINLSEVVAGWRLLVAGQVARKALEAGEGADGDREGEPGRSDAEFYAKKIQTVQWYLTRVLPLTTARARLAAKEDGSVMGWVT